MNPMTRDLMLLLGRGIPQVVSFRMASTEKHTVRRVNVVTELLEYTRGLHLVSQTARGEQRHGGLGARAADTLKVLFADVGGVGDEEADEVEVWFPSGEVSVTEERAGDDLEPALRDEDQLVRLLGW